MTSCTFKELYTWLHSKALLEPERKIPRFVHDSREIRAGDVFVAIPGAKCDGHDFISSVEKYASCAIVEQTYQKEHAIPLIHVPNTVQALQTIAQKLIEKINPKILAITGSLGKTTTKEFLYLLLKKHLPTCATIGNQNSQIGLALSIINNLQEHDRYLIAEMGMTEKGHIKKLVDIAPPDYALVTAVELVHAENFDTIDDIAHAKAEIFTHEKTSIGIINVESKCQSILLSTGNCHKKLYSVHQHEDAELYLEKIVDKTLYLREQGKQIIVTLPNHFITEKHIVQNLLAAILMVRQVNLTWKQIQESVYDLKLPEKRLESIVKSGITFINDSYNAAEASMVAALRYIKKQSAKGKKIAVLGQMKELGKFSRECHRNVATAALECVDEIVCYGQEAKYIDEVWRYAGRKTAFFINFQELIQYCTSEFKNSDYVLLKGSRSNELWKILEYF